jgi:hypothetical protein
MLAQRPPASAVFVGPTRARAKGSSRLPPRFCEPEARGSSRLPPSFLLARSASERVVTPAAVSTISLGRNLVLSLALRANKSPSG